MRGLIALLLISGALLFIGGCATAKAEIPIVMPDKTIQIVKLEYVRWVNQSIGWFFLQAPNGWLVGFGGQSADNGASIGYGPIKFKIGNNDE